ncbi:MAG: hypothetical protein HOE45_09375 [Gammaproteobacteria bacterium]|nr:hypothetical protein [Gammaproteobacteria bacterium]
MHNAKSSMMNGNALIMQGICPNVIFFCARPWRMAGNLTVKEFLDSVSTEPGSFKDNPPKAVLSAVNGEQIIDIVLELTSLFIDIVGRPMSPGPVSGVHRRDRRRVIMCH